MPVGLCAFGQEAHEESKKVCASRGSGFRVSGFGFRVDRVDRVDRVLATPYRRVTPSWW